MAAIETFKTRKGADKRCAELGRMHRDRHFAVVPQPSGFLHCIAVLDEAGKVLAYVQRTVSLKSAWTKAKHIYEHKSRAVTDWAIANGHGHKRHSELSAYVPTALWGAELRAYADVVELERKAIAAHKAWRCPSSGYLYWYR